MKNEKNLKSKIERRKIWKIGVWWSILKQEVFQEVELEGERFEKIEFDEEFEKKGEKEEDLKSKEKFEEEEFDEQEFKKFFKIRWFWRFEKVKFEERIWKSWFWWNISKEKETKRRWNID